MVNSERPSTGRVTLESVSDDGVYRASFEGSPSVAVIELLAVITGQEPSTLPPLFDTVDPEALDRVLDRKQPTDREGDVHVRIQWSGHSFSVHSDGTLVVKPSSADGFAADG